MATVIKPKRSETSGSAPTTSDLVAGEITEKMALRMNNATLVTVENAGHLVPGDNPAGFQIAINNFLNQL